MQRAHQNADSGASGLDRDARPLSPTTVIVLSVFLVEAGAMSLVFWLVDLLEGFAPLIKMGMEG